MIAVTGKNSGFCSGVQRALRAVRNLTGDNKFVLGEIVHNETVIRDISELGVRSISSAELSSVKNGDTVVVRTHGEPKETFDKLNEIGAEVVDCTCPFVKEIQKIVRRYYSDGYRVIIIGKADHPEIIGINGWCNNEALIINSPEEVPKNLHDRACVVVQTTYSEEKFNEIIKKFSDSQLKTVDIFKTICYTTTKRQKEARLISAVCDAVLVVGGAKSNNTDKLYGICAENCPDTYRLTEPSGFDYTKIKKFKKVGIVLGASTPPEQFQEVVSHMENVTEEIITTEVIGDEQTEAVESAPVEEVKPVEQEAVKSEMEKAFDNIKPTRDFKIGQIVSARISSANENGLTLSMKNVKNDFELPKDEMLSEYDKENYKDKIGSEIRVMVIGKAPLRLSEKAMEKVLKEEAEIEEIRNGKIFEAVITATNKGGLTGKYGSYEVFIPASQIKLGFVKDLEKYVGKTLRLKAEKVESRGARRQIVGSQRVILLAEKEERDAIRAAKEAEFFDNVQEGDIVLGTPVRFTSFGAFIDVNGFDCLAHISDLSWVGCKDCSEVLEIGKQYEFKILKLDVENKRVSVGYKQLQPKPWSSVNERYAIGDVIKGKVVRLVSFGAFVEVEKGIDGLVHVSQISNEWLENPVSALQVGQEIEAKILDINVEKEKMTLSIKALLPEVEKPAKVEKTGKGKKEQSEDEEPELREWKDDSNGGASIAEMLGNK